MIALFPRFIAARALGIALGLMVMSSLMSSAQAAVSMPRIFSDHMVLQRGDAVPVWGNAAPGEEITLKLADVSVKTRAGEDGRWTAGLPLSQVPKGPHVLSVEGTNKIAIQDVLIGEVWLCSGQSNMAFSLKEALGAKDAIAAAGDTQVREFRVGGIASADPRSNCGGEWQVADARTAGNFSAVGYFFGRAVARAVGEPVGLIQASVGGTPVEAWTSQKAIETLPEIAAVARGPREQWLVKFPAACEAYLNGLKALAENGRADRRSDASPFLQGDTAGWQEVQLPGKLSASGLPDSGVVWLRRTVDLPFGTDENSYRAIDLALPGGTFEVYWNGEKVGGVDDLKNILTFPGAMRRYILPAKLVKQGGNELAIRMYHPGEGLGVFGDASRISFAYRDGGKEDRIPLAGKWKGKMEQEFPPLSPEMKAQQAPLPGPAPNGSQIASALFNGFINPVIPYGVRGFIWYQGENNVTKAHQYRSTFPLLVRDWRAQWNNESLPFYFCQMPNFGPKRDQPVGGNWAELREAQTEALKEPHTGMAVLIDLGEASDIHPRNKQPAGERLAAVALHDTYRQETELSPVFDRAIAEGDKVRISFRNAKGGLRASELPAEYVKRNIPRETAPLVRNSPHSELEGFAVCGANGVWRWADARIDGETVIVDASGVPAPVSVRYAWADNPTCNLVSKAGLPVPPFRTDDLPYVTASQKK